MSRPKQERLQLHAAAIPGTERLLCDELKELGFKSVRYNRGGIPFRGTRQEAWRACLQSRLAQRIQLLMARFPAPDQKALYDGVRSIDWRPYLTWRKTMAVNAVSTASAMNHSGFVALKTKDAVVDQIRDRTGKRPSVDRDDPDVKIFTYLANDKASVYLDLSGDPLHRRGYRLKAGEAPLRETLAAVTLRLSGWDRRTPLYDPMCGSGTIAIEAAQWATHRAPNLNRKRFGFERWADFGKEQAEEMRELRGSLRQAISGSAPKIVAGDIDGEMVAAAKSNARAAGVRLSFKTRSVSDLQGGGEPGIVVTNPPYGVRLETDADLARRVASAFERLHGWRVCLLAGSRSYEKTIATRPTKKVKLLNGDLECDFLVYDIE